jgi:hypothetical protein
VQTRCFDYLDGGLAAADRQQVEAHLAACAVCRREMEMSRRSEAALSSALSATPPAGDLRAAFYARLAASRAPQPWWASGRLALPAVAACALVLMLWRPATTIAPPETTEPKLPNSLAATPAKPFSDSKEREGAGRREDRLDFAGRKIAAPIVAMPFESAGSAKRRASVENSRQSLNVDAAGQNRPLAEAIAPGVASGLGRAAGSPGTPPRQNPSEPMLPGKAESEARSFKEASSSTRPQQNALAAGGFGRGLSGGATPELRQQMRRNAEAISPHKTWAADKLEEQATLSDRKANADIEGAMDNTTYAFHSSLGAESPAEAPLQREKETTLNLYADSDALRSYYGVALQARRTALSIAPGEPNAEVDLNVEDDVRGFSASTRVQSSVEEREDGQILTIEADSAPESE